MLFTVDSDELFNDYFNLGNNNNNYQNGNNGNNITDDILTPKQGLNLGNMFASEYDQYKNYKPNELRASSEQDRDLLKIRELSFAVNDLNLKLDVDPTNQEYYRLFKMYMEELNDRIKKYSEKYEPLELCFDLGNEYSWYKNPWPWEVDKYV